MLKSCLIAGATALLCLIQPTLAEDNSMHFVTSADGTRIAYETQGSGPPLIFVVGAFNDHTTGAALAEVLAADFTVITYDRRGRGQSGDAATYTMQKELDDITALLAATGKAAALLGFSSGAMLIMESARRGTATGPLILVEPPYLLDQSRPRPSLDFPTRLTALIEAGKRGEAVELFQTDFIGIPRAVVEQLRHAPFRPGLEAIAHTNVYDATIAGDLTLDPTLPPAISQPVLTIAGTDSAPFLLATAKALAEMLPNGQFAGIAGMNHDLTPALAPEIAAFLGHE